MRYILERLREGPTYAGILVFLAGAFGIELEKGFAAQLQEVGMALAGMALMGLPNRVNGAKE